jgi:hypothetical protein
VIVGSLPGLVADVLSMTTGATMLLRRSPGVRTALINLIQLLSIFVRHRRIVGLGVVNRGTCK